MDTKARRKFPRKRTRKTQKPADFAEAMMMSKPPQPQIVMETDFHHYYYSLVESIPVPEPTWSTTAPAVLCAAAAPEPAEDALVFEWAAENEGEAWWVGFLKSLDCKSGKGEVGNHCRVAQENTVAAVESCKEATAAAMDSSAGTFPEDWLCFPAAEDHADDPAT